MKRNQDHYTRRAHQSGYPARSVYKLQEIQKKFHPVSAENTVLDIGSAPGSWTRFLSEVVGPRGRVVAVDMAATTVSGENIEVIVGDIFDQAVADHLGALPAFHAVVSDAAPATTGNRTIDTARSAALAERAVYLAEKLLRDRGNLIVKIFQGGDEKEILDGMRSTFASARMFKPKACRSESFETYLIGLGFMGRSGQ